MKIDEIQTERCKELISAVLKLAISDFRADARKVGIEKAITNEVGHWIFSESQRPFGCIWCCEALSVHIDTMRRGLLNRIENAKAA